MADADSKALGHPLWPNVSQNELLMMEVRQFAVGLDPARRPSDETVALAERLVGAAYTHTVEPDINCYDDGFMGYILELPNGNIVMAVLEHDGTLKFGHHDVMNAESGNDHLQACAEQDLLFLLEEPVSNPNSCADDESALRNRRRCDEHEKTIRDAETMVSQYLEDNPDRASAPLFN